MLVLWATKLMTQNTTIFWYKIGSILKKRRDLYRKSLIEREGQKLDQADFEWVQIRGLNALEALVSGGPYSVGSSLTFADLYLVPQLRNFVDRFEVIFNLIPF